MASYAMGKTNGLIVDSGYDITHAVPIYEGYPITRAIKRSEVSGRLVDLVLKGMLTECGTNFESSASEE